MEWSGSIKAIRKAAYTLGHQHGCEIRYQNKKNAMQGYAPDSLPEWLARKHAKEHKALAKKAARSGNEDIFYTHYDRGEEAGRNGKPNIYGVTSTIRRGISKIFEGEARVF